MDRIDGSFEALVQNRTGPDFIERRWLHERIEQARGSHILVTGEPGAGKTSLLAGLARAHPDWLRYFGRRDSRSALTGGDVQSFLLSIGHQLARQRPGLFEPQRLEVVVRQHIDATAPHSSVVGIRIDDLTVSPFYRTATLHLDQQVAEVAGRVSGIEIGSAQLEPRLLEPANLAYLALIGPAEALLSEDPAARIVILLDALDEFADDPAAASLLRWLAQVQELPPNVTLIMASRPHAALAPLRDRATELPIDPASAQVAEDLLVYAAQALGTPPVLAAVRTAGHLQDSFLRAAVRRAAGNFLYLSTYARALTDAVEGRDPALTARLLDPVELPDGLNGLYAFFINTARTDLHRLGMQDIRDPTGAADTLTPAWEGVGRPLLGLLAVARAALTAEQLATLAGVRVWPRAVQDVVARLRWLLDERDGRIAFYHASIGEFLTADQTRRDHPDIWIDQLEWHQRIVRRYQGDAPGWAEVRWNAVDPYGLVHLADHALRCGGKLADEAAVELVCPGLLRAIRHTFGGHSHFQRQAGLLADHAIEHFTRDKGIPAVLYLGIVRRRLLGTSRSVVPAALGLLARLRRTGEALEHMTAMGPSYQQFRATLAIFEHARPDDGSPTRRELLELVVQAALAIPPSKEGYARGQRLTAPLRNAATLLTPYDLDRALRLWQHAWDLEYADRGENAPPWEQQPDEVYFAAAAAEQDTARARMLIASMSPVPQGPSGIIARGHDQPNAYLDLAARSASTDVPVLLRLAEAALEAARPAIRLRCLARLAAAWVAHDAAESDRIQAALRAEAARDPQALRDSLEKEDFSQALVDAADHLHESHPAMAHHLLNRVTRLPLNSGTARAYLGTAALMAAWGSPGQARTVIDRVEATTHDTVRAGATLAAFDRDAGLGMLARAYDRMPPASDPDWDSSLELRLHVLAVMTAPHDGLWAARIAHDLTRTTWTGFEQDRYSTLAHVAHTCLDKGDTAQAEEILAECLRAGDDTPPLLGGRPRGYYRLAVDGQAPPEPLPAHLQEMSDLYNSSHQWAARANTYFYRDPAAVVKDVSQGPYNWGRTARTIAEALAERDLPRALATVEHLTDWDERTIGLAEMFLQASRHGLGKAATVSDRLDEELAALPRYEWLGGDADEQAWAYLRPDHRVRFEVAQRIFPFRPRTAGELTEATPFLARALWMDRILWASRTYAEEALGGGTYQSGLGEIHERTLGPSWAAGRQHMLVDLTVAAAAFHEHVVATTRPDLALPTTPPVPHNPIYAAAAELVTPAHGETLTPAFVARIRGLLAEDMVVAAAQLVAYAADIRPAAAVELRELCSAVIAATARTSPATRVDALARLALPPALAGVVDPAEVLREAARPGVLTAWEPWVPQRVRHTLFPLLLAQDLPVALRGLYDAVADDWEEAMALLEHGADQLLSALGPDAVAVLHTTIQRALRCTSADLTAPDLVDGLRHPTP